MATLINIISDDPRLLVLLTGKTDFYVTSNRSGCGNYIFEVNDGSHVLMEGNGDISYFPSKKKITLKFGEGEHDQITLRASGGLFSRKLDVETKKGLIGSIKSTYSVTKVRFNIVSSVGEQLFKVIHESSDPIRREVTYKISNSQELFFGILRMKTTCCSSEMLYNLKLTGCFNIENTLLLLCSAFYMEDLRHVKTFYTGIYFLALLVIVVGIICGFIFGFA